MGDGETTELIFRLIYYMLNNVVILVKYGVFITVYICMCKLYYIVPWVFNNSTRANLTRSGYHTVHALVGQPY
jgi:hypothetical protein